METGDYHSAEDLQHKAGTEVITKQQQQGHSEDREHKGEGEGPETTEKEHGPKEQNHETQKYVEEIERYETRCDSLKKQLDYMKMLYRGVPQKGEESKSPTCSEISLKIEPSVQSVIDNRQPQGLPDTVADPPNKDSTLSQHGGKKSAINADSSFELVTDLTRIKSSAVTKEISQEGPATSLHAQKMNNQCPREQTSSVDVINNILTGISQSVNRISEINVQIDEKHKKSVVEKTGSRRRMRSANVDRYMASIFSGDTEPPQRDSNEEFLERLYPADGMKAREMIAQEPEKPYIENSCSESVSDTDVGENKITDSHNRFTTHSVESSETLKTSRKKMRTKHEKKIKPISPYALVNKQKLKGNEDALSVSAKLKKKKTLKVKNTSSRNTIGYKPEKKETRKKISGNDEALSFYSASPVPYQIWPTDNVVELYHNAAARPETSASDINVYNKETKPVKRNFSTKLVKQKNKKPASISIEPKRLPEYTSGRQVNESIKNRNRPGHLQEGKNQLDTHIENKKSDDSFETKEPTNEETESPDDMMTVDIVKQKIQVQYPNKDSQNAEKKRELTKRVSMSTTRHFNDRATTVCGTNQKRNFELPTVASQMKQADRSSSQNFTFRTIPFVVGMSTTPSHNLGLNIQQALSILKQRHPASGLPPMKVANEFLREQQQTLNAGQSRLLGPLSSRISCCTEKQNTCPALVHGKELPDLPEKDEEETDAVNQKTMKLAKLDKEPQLENPWSPDDPENVRPRCTCFPARSCTDYQKLLSQYLGRGTNSTDPNRFSQPCHILKRNCDVTSQKSSTTAELQTTFQNCDKAVTGKGDGDTVPTKDVCGSAVPLCAREQNDTSNPYLKRLKERNKSLRDVMMNLHRDFVHLNNKCEELRKAVKQDQHKDTKAFTELEAIEKELETKEDEITVMIYLYEEVQKLRQQKQVLLHQISCPDVPWTGKLNLKIKQSRQPTLSVRLTKVLRNIQQFQQKLRQE